MALISGDTTRRNVPGNAFRRAKARLIKKGKAALNAVSPASTKPGAGSVEAGTKEGSTSAMAVTGESKDDGDTFEELPLHRLRLVPALSRVSEEGPMSRTSKSSVGGFSCGSERDLESGSGGARVSSRPARIGETDETKDDTDDGVDVNRPWSVRRTSDQKKDAAASGSSSLTGSATGASGGVRLARSEARHESGKVTSIDTGKGADKTSATSRGRPDTGTIDVDSGDGRRGSSTERAPSRGVGATRSSIRLNDSVRQARLESSSSSTKKKKGTIEVDSDSSTGGAAPMHGSTRPFPRSETDLEMGRADHSSNDEQGTDSRGEQDGIKGDTSRRRRKIKTPGNPAGSTTVLPPVHVGRVRRRAAKVKSAARGTKTKAPSASPLEIVSAIGGLSWGGNGMLVS